MRIYRRYGEIERDQEKKHNVCVFYAQLSIFRTPIFLLPLPSHHFLPVTALSNRKPLIRRYLLDCVLETKKKIVCQWFTQTTVNMYMSSYLFSLSPSFLFLPFVPHFIPHWLTCFTSTAVISTAFAELINGAETTPPLCLLRTWITTSRKGGSSVRKGRSVKETEGEIELSSV